MEMELLAAGFSDMLQFNNEIDMLHNSRNVLRGGNFENEKMIS
jgi:hypothetical protein